MGPNLVCRFVMTRCKNLWTIILLSSAILAMLLLSAGPSRIELLPGEPFLLEREADAETADRQVSEAEMFQMLLRGFLLLLAAILPIGLPLAIIYMIISRRARRQVFRDIMLVVTIILVLQALRRMMSEQSKGGFDLAPNMSPLAQALSSQSLADMVAAPPRWFILVVSFLLALLFAVLLGGIAWFLWRRSRQAETPLEQLAQEAQDALDALHAGIDLRNVVLRCYARMNQVLREQRGIVRHKAMTPREFERQLATAGLPHEQIRQLTRLFERFRYGNELPDEGEEHQAMACLRAIVEACGGPP